MRSFAFWASFANKKHDLSALRDSFLDQFARLATGSDVISADVEGALARRITIW